MVKYELDERFINKQKEAFETGEPIIMNLRDNETLEWKYVKGILSKKSQEGLEEVNVTNQYAIPVDKYYVKIVEELSDEGELGGALGSLEY